MKAIREQNILFQETTFFQFSDLWKLNRRLTLGQIGRQYCDGEFDFLNAVFGFSLSSNSSRDT